MLCIRRTPYKNIQLGGHTLKNPQQPIIRVNLNEKENLIHNNKIFNPKRKLSLL